MVDKVEAESNLEKFKRDLYHDIISRKRVFEAENNLVIKDIELVFVDVSTPDHEHYLLNEINITL